YRETYRSAGSIPAKALPPSFGGARAFSTAIYFLLAGKQQSMLHRIKSDEVWHFYCGTAVFLHIIDVKGKYSRIRLGGNPDKGEVLQAVVPAGCWFGAKPTTTNSYVLVGCTVAPGFDFTDFELGDRAWLLRRYPQHQGVIEEQTKMLHE
ncbi:MAG: cupin domain-containing protein, partial [bacterium]